MSLILIQDFELKAMLEDVFAPIHKELQVMRTLIEADGKALSVKEFSKKAGFGQTKIRLLMEAGKIDYSQTIEGGKITIQPTELLKLKQL